MWDRLRRVFSGRQPAQRATPQTSVPSPLARRRFGSHVVLPFTRQRTELSRQRGKGGFQFLGLGVSHEASDFVSDTDRLTRLQLPLIETGERLASSIGFSQQRLRWLAFHNEQTRSCNYHFFTVEKRSGGQRQLAAPRPHIDACSRWIQREILERIEAHPAAHGFVRGKSIQTNASLHTQQDVVVNLDLCDFFPSIVFRRVRGLFKSFGYNGQVATLLALLTTEPPRTEITNAAGNVWKATGPRHLPQGARTSPAISNLVCRALDRRMTGLCRTLSWNYSRYADDMTFSAKGDAAKRVGYLLHRIRGIASDEGFTINEDKTRVQRRSQSQEVTGLVVNDHVAVSRKTIRRVRAILHNASSTGLAAQNVDGRENFTAWLEGMIGFIEQTDSKRGAQLRAKLQELKSSS